jgi:uncharacterized protein YndB with AHSA1/START domain
MARTGGDGGAAGGAERGGGRADRRPAASGYQVVRTRAFAAPVAALYAAWLDEKGRRRWLPNPDFTVRTATRDEALLLTWVDGDSRVEVRFALRGDGRSQLSVEHSRLADAGEVAAMKDYWSEALERLDAVLAGRPVAPPL